MTQICRKCGQNEVIHGKHVCYTCNQQNVSSREVLTAEGIEFGLCVGFGGSRDDERYKNCHACRERLRNRVTDPMDRYVPSDEPFIEPVLDDDGHAELEGVYGDPTKATPGSSEKVEVMASRYESGFSLFHPDDERDYAASANGAGLEELMVETEFDDDEDWEE